MKIDRDEDDREEEDSETEGTEVKVEVEDVLSIVEMVMLGPSVMEGCARADDSMEAGTLPVGPCDAFSGEEVACRATFCFAGLSVDIGAARRAVATSAAAFTLKAAFALVSNSRKMLALATSSRTLTPRLSLGMI